MVDESLSRRIIASAAVTGASGVLLGAFAAHGLEGYLQSQWADPSAADLEKIVRRVGQFDVGVRYQLIHAVALLALSAVPLGSPTRRRSIARMMLMGVLLFSGSLYVLVLTDTPILGAVTPIGGVCWIVAWAMLLSLKPPNDESPGAQVPGEN